MQCKSTRFLLFLYLLIAQYINAFHVTQQRQKNIVTFQIISSERSVQRSSSNGGGRRQAPVKEVRPPMNDEISAPMLRVTTPSPKGKDELLGIMSRDEALKKAKELGNLDLILVNNNSDPPVCKIVDYSKYRYALEKKAKEVKKNSKTSELKEVKMSYKIDVHDYDVRKKNAMKFLRQGNRVKCTIMFRGREVQHDNLGFELLERLAADLDDTCIKENRPRREGRFMSVILSPRPEVMKALNEKRRKMDKLKKQQRIERLEKGGAVDDEEDEDDDIVISLDDDDDDDEDNDDDIVGDYDEDDDYDDEDDDEEEGESENEIVQDVAIPPAPTKKQKTLEEILGTSDYL
jgi:translation initiation factor IF-3